MNKQNGGAKTTKPAAAQQPEEKDKGGRPKKTLKDLPRKWEEKMLKLAREGGSLEEIKATVLNCISNDLWYRLIDEEPKFSETVRHCKMLSIAWWEKLGRAGAIGQTPIQPTTWIFNMKNRAGWTDRQDIQQTITGGVLRVEVVKDETTDDWASDAQDQQKDATEIAESMIEDE